MSKLSFYHPFKLFIYGSHEDVCEYGIRLDLTTELVYYTYDWGWGIEFRLLGFGFHLARYGF